MERLVREGVIGSFSEGVRIAVDRFLESVNKARERKSRREEK